jgi:hypothetical protein
MVVTGNGRVETREAKMVMLKALNGDYLKKQRASSYAKPVGAEGTNAGLR